MLIHSTIHPETPERFAETAPANVTVLDTPVSGTRTRPESADSFVLENWKWLTDGWGDVQPGDCDGVAHICQRDLLLALDLAESVELPVPGTGIASQEVPAFFRELADEERIDTFTLASDDNYLGQRPEYPPESA